MLPFFPIKRLRLWTRLLATFIRRYYLILTTTSIIGIGLFFVSPYLTRLIPKTRPTLRIGLVGNFTPENLPLFIQQQVSIGLTTLAPDGSPKSGIATRWQAKDHGKTWEFTISDQFSWHDGQPLTAQDIRYRFHQVQLQALDDHTLRFQLTDRFSPFPVIVSQPIFRQGLTGIGPYRLHRSITNRHSLRLLKLVPQDQNSLLPNITYKFYPTEQAAKIGLKLGKIDQVKNITQPEEFTNWHNLSIESQQRLDAYVAIFFNTQNPHFKNKAVRQALAYAIQDKNFNHQRVTSPINSRSWAYNPTIKTYDYNLEKAQKLLSSSQEADSANLQITLSSTPSLLNVAEKIATDWQALGVATQVQLVSSVPDQFDALLAIQQIPPDPDQYSLWHSTQPGNITRHQNPRLDQLLETGRKELDREKRKEIYQDFQRYLLEDCPAVFLFHPQTYTITRTTIQNKLTPPLSLTISPSL